MKKLLILIIMISMLACKPDDDPIPTPPKGGSDLTITDGDIENKTYNWKKDTEYLIDGLVYLEEGGLLNIEEGTIIKFKKSPTNPGSNPTSALIITRGAKINAVGTSSEPIIFTSELDDLNGSLGATDNQQWAGLILLGRAPAEKGGSSEIQIEGIPSSEPRGIFGGIDKNDNSGILKYVSIRYTGFALNGVAGDEIQGLTLGGVGAGTTLDYIDIYSSADDGIEIFGGTVDISHISVAFATDDSYDFDLGWRGKATYIFALQGDESIGFDHVGEWDGASPDDGALFSAPEISYATFIGPGLAAVGRDKAILMRENFAGKIKNSIFADFPGYGIQIEDIDEIENDSYSKITNPKDGYQIELIDNIWSQFALSDDLASIPKPSGQISDVIEELENNGNIYQTESAVNSISRNRDRGLDPISNGEGGAFQSGNWLKGWSTLDKFGYLK
jgi:hypothetical protein